MCRDVGQRFATEGSAEVAQEDDERRPLAGQRLKGGVRGIDERRHLVTW
jgi:hypothetical protein